MADHYLLFRAAGRLHALRVGSVLEIMRPLPIETINGAPDFVLGVAMIRGCATTVLSASLLVVGAPAEDVRRWVHVRAEAGPPGRTGTGRTIALAVADVIGIRREQELALQECAPLLREADRGMVEQLGRLDGELLRQLRAGICVPELPPSSTSPSRSETG
jgi:purine-binding chemotaxis protein CheW